MESGAHWTDWQYTRWFQSLLHDCLDILSRSYSCLYSKDPPHTHTRFNSFQVLMVKFKITSPQISFHGWLFISILGLTAFVAMRFLYHFHAILDRIHAGFCHFHSSISGQNKYSELGCEQSRCALKIHWERCVTSIFSDAERREMIEHSWEKHYRCFRCKISVFLWR